jgi:hypothetical protein
MEAVDSDDNKYVSNYNKMRAFNDNLAPLVAIRENDLKKIANNVNYVKLSEYVDTEIAKISNNRKTYIKWRWYTRCQAISKSPHSALLSDVIINELQKTAPNAKVTKYLTKCQKFSRMPGMNLNAIANFMGWDSGTVLNAKFQNKLSLFHKAMMERYPLVRIYPDWQVRNSITAEHLAKYVSVM